MREVSSESVMLPSIKTVPSGKRCLVVEVSPQWKTLLQDAVENLGFQATVCTSVDQALELLRHATFDLVVQDLSLDEMRQYKAGFELLKWLHGNENPHKIPIVVVTGTADIGDVIEILNNYPHVTCLAPKDQFHLSVIRNQFEAAVERSLKKMPWRDYNLKRSTPRVFVAKSFDKDDKGVNKFFEALLASVGLDVRTGEPYSDESVPVKIESMIRDCDALVAILVKKRINNARVPVPPPWVVREVEFAKGIERQTILIAEKGVDAPWLHDRELIVFERSEIKGTSDAGLKLLQALTFHRLIS